MRQRLNRVATFAREDGFYLLLSRLVTFARGTVRNFFLARRLGVKKIRIGPRPYLRGLSFMQLGEDFSAEEGLWLESISSYNDQRFTPKIIIGRCARLSRFVHITATNRVENGDDVLIGSGVLISDHNHGHYSRSHTSPEIPPTNRPLDDNQQVTIGKNVWLGEAVVVTAGASIGDGSVISAHSVVIGQIPAFCIAAGAPATVRKIFKFDTRQWSPLG